MTYRRPLTGTSTIVEVLESLGAALGILPRHIDAIGAEIVNRFVLIPRAETEPVTREVLAPNEVLRDGAAWPTFLPFTLESFVTLAYRDGWAVVGPVEVSATPGPLYTDSTVLRLSALGRRVPPPASAPDPLAALVETVVPAAWAAHEQRIADRVAGLPDDTLTVDDDGGDR